MKKNKENFFTLISENTKKTTIVVVSVINLLIILILIMTLVVYFGSHSKSEAGLAEDRFAELSDGTNEQLTLFFEEQSLGLLDRKKYVESKNLTMEEGMDYLSHTITKEAYWYQIISCDSSSEYFSGQSVGCDGETGGVAYSQDNTSIAKAVDEVMKGSILDSDLNITDAFLSSVQKEAPVLALYTDLRLRVDDKKKHFLFLCVFPVNSVSDIISIGKYTEATTAVIDYDGNYIVLNGDFKNEVFYDYLFYYNDKNMNTINPVKKSIQDDAISENPQGGRFHLNNHLNENVYFVFQGIKGTKGWSFITAIPMNSLDTRAVSITFLVTFVGLVLLILAFDLAVLFTLQKRLRLSRITEEQAKNESEDAARFKGSFLSRMSHEIRTPLNTVLGYMAVAHNNYENTNKLEECIMKTENAAKKLLAITNDILDISAIESGRIKIINDNFNFNNIITALSKMFYTTATGKGIEFDVELENVIDEVMIGDSVRINQILINILDNAVKFTPVGGSVLFSIRQTELENNKISLLFTIKDTGIGMSKELIAHIWEPFEQAEAATTRRFGGTGLGLTITKSLVEMMDGSIELESKEGFGTTFMITLTLDRTEQPIISLSPQSSSLNVLLIDNQVSCSYLSRALANNGISCSAALNEAAALEIISKAESLNHPFNLCILGIREPKSNDLDTLKRLKETFGEELPIIVLSSLQQSEVKEEVLAEGADDFLQKPVFPTNLFSSIRSICCPKYVPQNSITGQEPDLHGVRLLLAEDNEMNFDIAIELLQMTGAKIDGVKNGRDAVDKFLSAPPKTYSAILMDIIMPVLNGYDATKEIRNSTHPEAKTIPIIAMSARSFDDDDIAANDSGINEHILKPINEQTLYNVIKKYITE